MYAIVKIQGQQFKVEKDQDLLVNRLETDEGKSITFKEVLLVDNEGKVKVGTPHVSRANVKAKVIEHVQDDKVLVFKKKRRKGYQKMNGHRQAMTRIHIESIKA